MLIPKSVWEALGEEGYGVRGDYSGRAMYGETCAGFTTGCEFALGIDLGRLMGEDAEKLANKARTDSMGRDTIVYFPGVKLEDWQPEKDDRNEDDSDDEEDDEDE